MDSIHFLLYRKSEEEFQWPSQKGEKRVELIGSWDSWSVAHPMKRQGANFVLTLQLLPGTYEYKFLVDGDWQSSPNLPKSVRDPFNNVLVVSPSIRTSLQGLRTKHGRPFIFMIKTSLSLEAVVEKAKAICRVEGAYHLALRDGSQVLTTDQIAEGDILYLDCDDVTDDASVEDIESGLAALEIPDMPATNYLLAWTNDKPSIGVKSFPSLDAATEWMKTVDPGLKLKWNTKDTRSPHVVHTNAISVPTSRTAQSYHAFPFTFLVGTKT